MSTQPGTKCSECGLPATTDPCMVCQDPTLRSKIGAIRARRSQARQQVHLADLMPDSLLQLTAQGRRELLRRKARNGA